MTALSTPRVSLPARGMGQRLSIRDRNWLDVDNVRIFGPFHEITADGLRTALVRLHAADPARHAVCSVERRPARWVPLSAEDFGTFSHDLVVELPEPPLAGPWLGEVPSGGPPAAAAAVTRTLLDTPLDDRPLLLVVCGGYVGAKISHAVGDGRIVNTVFPALLRAAAEDRVPAMPADPVERLPLLRAAMHTFASRPGRLLGAARVIRPPGVDAREAGPTVLWRADPAYISRPSTQAMAQIRRWRDQHAPGVSAAAVLFSATAAALARCGLEPRWPGAVVLVDVRRYLPKGRSVDGNFSWGQYLHPADLRDPRSVHRTMVDELASGRALTMLALRTARLLMTPGPGVVGAAAEPTTVPARPRPQLTLTHIGRLTAYDDLPWAVPAADRANISAPTTGGPEAVTVSFSELSGVLHVNASFHRSTFDVDVLRQAVELICADPVALVQDRSA